jgi:hypothetical protein
MDAATADLFKDVIDAMKIIIPMVIMGCVNIFITIYTVKHQFNIERFRLHEKNSVDAHSRLLKFARYLQNDTFPLAENKRNAFKDIMRTYYIGKLELDYVYFSRKVADVLDTIEEHYVCMTRGELIPEMDPDNEKEFIEHKLFQLAETLTKYVKKTMKEKGVSA